MAEKEDKWTPDKLTIKWCFGVAHEERVKDAIRADVEMRSAGIPIDSDEYWELVAEVAIEAILYDLLAMAEREWGRKPGWMILFREKSLGASRSTQT
ncbi:hypothetical protein [Nonomuraea turcica]|uniref:hypothetical protein n=1 Tax=Nonomuraea sp. G32 TaxID=3067274 RepID=UPI00273AC80F|nr:hypothetical protein [Nonomuraea sp. G32]MDP4511535.1 hypothetical protein [Nonomuraea sp. G32]